MNPTVGLVWYASGEHDPNTMGNGDRLAPLAEALTAAGLTPVAIPYRHDEHEAAGRQLRGCAAAMVWVNPIEDGLSRHELDELLYDLESSGVVVTAGHEARRRIGTKAVIHETREMEWGTDSNLYRSHGELRDVFPERLRSRGPRVLKQERGHSGEGVWKIEALDGSHVRTTSAGTDETAERPLDAFLDDWAPHFADGGIVVEQPFLPSVSEGMIRCYVSGNRVLGLIHQLPKTGGLNVSRSGLARSDGLAAGSYYYPADTSPHPALIDRLRTTWIHELCDTVALEPSDLPVLWDIDFIGNGDDRYALCEINVNSVSPPADAPLDVIAATLASRLSR